ncbi:hypothetical protein [Pelagibius sp. Alg239-R121]|uniref:hypothetical protein n=1 Tax=Pelagibius sp. Alg239-R121 TaxID=2993448 RepID=UPI0024A6DE8B|nr:hypothetical protein [Pelagibius sp. Alg239-R121]
MKKSFTALTAVVGISLSTGVAQAQGIPVFGRGAQDLVNQMEWDIKRRLADVQAKCGVILEEPAIGPDILKLCNDVLENPQKAFGLPSESDLLK